METTLVTKDFKDLDFKRGKVEYKVQEDGYFVQILKTDYGSYKNGIAICDELTVSFERRDITFRYLDLFNLGLNLKDIKMIGKYLSRSKPVIIEWKDKELMGFKNGQEY